MVQTIRIEAEPRELAGKGAARATRRAGLVPAVIYGAKEEATLIALDPRDVMKEMHKGGWASHLYEVAIKGGATVRTLMRDVQFHPLKDTPMHVDFQRLAAGQLIRVKVPVVFLNEATNPGVKEGGVVNAVHRELEVMCDPDQVPEHFEVDLGEFGIGHSFHWDDVKDKHGVKPMQSGNFVVASIAPPKVVEEEIIVAPTAAPAAPAKGKAAKGKK
jgi:large subunit ribosomal protein L25